MTDWFSERAQLAGSVAILIGRAGGLGAPPSPMTSRPTMLQYQFPWVAPDKSPMCRAAWCFWPFGLSTYVTGSTLHPDGGTHASSGWFNWREHGWGNHAPRSVLDLIGTARSD